MGVMVGMVVGIAVGWWWDSGGMLIKLLVKVCRTK